MTMRDLGTFIREERHQRHLTQAQLAEPIGIDRSYLSKIEEGEEHSIGYRILRGLAITLEVPLAQLDDLLCGPDESGVLAATGQNHPGRHVTGEDSDQAAHLPPQARPPFAGRRAHRSPNRTKAVEAIVAD